MHGSALEARACCCSRAESVADVCCDKDVAREAEWGPGTWGKGGIWTHLKVSVLQGITPLAAHGASAAVRPHPLGELGQDVLGDVPALPGHSDGQLQQAALVGLGCGRAPALLAGLARSQQQGAGGAQPQVVEEVGRDGQAVGVVLNAAFGTGEELVLVVASIANAALLCRHRLFVGQRGLRPFTAAVWAWRA